MVYELYKGGYLMGSAYINWAIQKISKNKSECRTYISYVNGTTKTFKGNWHLTNSRFVKYMKPGDAERMIFLEMI